MGCGGSVAEPATDAQKQEMASAACHECICICAQKVVDIAVDKKTITIAAPTAELDELRKVSKQIRDGAAQMQEALDSSGGQAAEAVSAGLGSLGSLGAMAGGLAGKAAAAAGSVAGSATKKSMLALADALDAPIAKLDKQFSGVAVELVTAKRAEIVGAYNAILVNCAFADAMKTVRGDEYDFVNCPKDRVSTQFMSVCKDDLKTKLDEAVMSEVQQSLVVNTWKQAVDSFNDCVKVISGDEKPAIKLDICKYIVDSIFDQLTEEMKKYEGVIRGDPTPPEAKRPDTFKLVFSAEKLNSDHYKAFKEGK